MFKYQHTFFDDNSAVEQASENSMISSGNIKKQMLGYIKSAHELDCLYMGSANTQEDYTLYCRVFDAQFKLLRQSRSHEEAFYEVATKATSTVL